MKIAVVGAGTLGTFLGGVLAHAGHDVWLLHHREAYVRALETDGVHVESQSLPAAPIDVSVPATTDADDVGHADLALVLVKAHQTRAALQDHRACIGPDTRVLTLQNGFRCYDAVIDLVGSNRALGGMTYQGARLEAPGVVHHTGAGETVFGGDDGAFARRVRDAFESAGIEDVSVVSDPRPTIWDKQLVGLAIKPVAALTRLPNAAISTDDGLVTIMEGLVAEAASVAEARGIPVTVHERFDEVIERLSTSRHRSSMLQDVEAGRRTEIAGVNGAVVEMAAVEGIDVPYNRTLTALVRGLEQGYLDGD